MPAPYILARTFAEAHTFARRDLGLKAGYYRVVNSPGTLKAVRGVDLYLVPGWQNRYDRFAMQSAMRWTRMNVIDVAEQKSAPPAAEPVSDQILVSSTEDFTNFLTAGVEEPAAPDVAEAAEPAQEQPKRRRRRCKECGVLVEPDEVDEHAADHAADLVSLGNKPEGV